MKLRKEFIIALMLVICLVLTGCGAKDSAAPAGAPAEEKAAVSEKTYAPIEVAAHVQQAIDAANLLTDDCTAIAPGEGIIVNGGYFADHLPMYSLYDLKKLAISPSRAAALALTNANELYYWNIKVADGVEDVIYATTNMNEEGWYTTVDGDVYNVTKDFDHHSISTRQVHDGAAPVNAIGVEKHDLFIVWADGTIYTDGSAEHWAKCEEFKNWGADIAVIDASKVMNREDRGVADYVTVAAITADGRTLAVGDFAEDILAMGELSYITMGDGAIIGLKTDGTLAVAGPYAQQLTDLGFTSLSGITGVKVGPNAISAVDASGNYYFSRCYNSGSYGEIDKCHPSGNYEGYASLRIYDDSYLYFTEGAGWYDSDENPRPESADVVWSPATSIEYPLTEESVKAYLDGLFADKKDAMEKDGYDWFGVYLTDDGYLTTLQVTTQGFIGDIDPELYSYVAKTIAGSELLSLTPAAMDELNEFNIVEEYDSFRADGWSITHTGSPYGEVIDISHR